MSSFVEIDRSRIRAAAGVLIVAGLMLASACAPQRMISTMPQASQLPTDAALARNPELARPWGQRLTADDLKVRQEAQTALVEARGDSLPLLRVLARSRNEKLRLAAIEVIRQIGPPAIPLVVQLLHDPRPQTRYDAVGMLIDLTPETESVQGAICVAMEDDDVLVARDAARALGALGAKAAPSVPALVKALSHVDADVRQYAAEALASVGPGAAAATNDLVKLLHDPEPGVRWGACEALASIGPEASAAVPQLIESLKDEFLYVRICAASALGSIGPGAMNATDALKEAAMDPAIRAEAEWAVARITGAEPPDHTAATVPVNQSTSLQPLAPAISETSHSTGSPPTQWDIDTNRNIVWSVELGQEAFGRPVVSDGVVYVGTDNSLTRNRAVQDACGVLAAFRASDGQFLWQDLSPRVKRGMGEFLLPSTTSAPYIEGNRLYYVTAECQLRCLDAQGFRDGRNDGPYASEPFQDNTSADIVWELDMCNTLGVFPHEASNSDVLAIGDTLFVSTSNGQNEGHTRVPSPRAPSLIAVDKHTGNVLWRAIGPGANLLHGQWCSPSAAVVNGRPQVLFGGGDGVLRAYDAESGREIWRFDGNPKDSRYLPRPNVFSRGQIIASPVYAEGRVYIAMGVDPLHGNGPSLLHAINPNGQGDVTESRHLWTNRDVGRVIGKPIVSDGLLYVADLGGKVHCVDAATGATIWQHDTRAPIWGCLVLAADHLYVGNESGVMTILRAGRMKQVLPKIEMNDPLRSRPEVMGDSMYLATSRRLYLIAEEPR